MSHIIPRKPASVEQNWLHELTNAISKPEKLLEILEIPRSQWPKDENGVIRFDAKDAFSQRVPEAFVGKMEKGNIQDPLLRQVLPVSEELLIHPGYSSDPLQEQDNEQPALLHKYKNRALLILKGGCAINCRYCFRRHFPYDENRGSKSVWKESIQYISKHNELNEVILSGGDPLMAKDHELEWLIEELSTISHIKRLRIHSRLPVVIPSRITDKLCNILETTRLQVVFVSHINHANEIDQPLIDALARLKKSQVHLLNQGVLLKGVNDSADAQVELNEALFDAGVQPYYLHVLDKVQGAAHFYVSDKKAKRIMAEVMSRVSGYIVPKLTREEAGKTCKTPLDLSLES